LNSGPPPYQGGALPLSYGSIYRNSLNTGNLNKAVST
jgi:hypothetical protein